MEPGNIFKRIGGTKMTEEILQEDEIKEITTVDEDGNIRTVYYIWHNQLADVIIEFYVDHLQVIHRTWRALRILDSRFRA